MASTTNFFTLFGFTPTFKVDLKQLDQTYQQLQSETHPDRFASASEAEKWQAIQQSSVLNDGYRTLKHAVSRAECLILLAGKSTDAAVSPAFLMMQMDWREQIEMASTQRDGAKLDALYQQLQLAIGAHEERLGHSIDIEADYAMAAELVNELRFYEKLLVDINNALDTLDN